jgi:hypothetical protein
LIQKITISQSVVPTGGCVKSEKKDANGAAIGIVLASHELTYLTA